MKDQLNAGVLEPKEICLKSVGEPPKSKLCRGGGDVDNCSQFA